MDKSTKEYRPPVAAKVARGPLAGSEPKTGMRVYRSGQVDLSGVSEDHRRKVAEEMRQLDELADRISRQADPAICGADALAAERR